jgi:hypothetical protein
LGEESSRISDFPKSPATRPAMSSPTELPFLATIRVHEGVTNRGTHHASTKGLENGGPVKRNAEIEQLRLELASFNERINELEKQHPDASKIEALKTSALVLARQIDEIRCSSTPELTYLLAK